MTTSPAPARKRGASADRDISPPAAKRKSAPTTSKQVVQNFFTPLSQKGPEKIQWRIESKTLIAGKYLPSAGSLKSSSVGTKQKIAAFDFDSTLITTKTGRRHPTGASDWKWWHSVVPNKLKMLHKEGYLIAIVSNQGGISLKVDPKLPKGEMKKYADFKQKSTAVLNLLDLPIALYAATEHDLFRKPSVGMWTTLLRDHALDPSMVDMDQSIFVGDAAGRLQHEKHAKDFSCSDRNLADNIGIRFQTPEEFFLNEKPRPFQRDFEPLNYVQPMTSAPFTTNNTLDLVIFVGSPGSGKSTFFSKQLAPLGYHRVNQDILKKRERCVQVASEHLQRKESVAVDNTNRNKATRKVWVDLARSFGIPIRCIYFTANVELCKHNNVVRALNEGHNPEQRDILPAMAFPSYARDFELPELGEGFEDITRIDFAFQGTDDERLVWTKHWT